MLNDYRHDLEKENMADLTENPTIHAMLALVNSEYASMVSYARIIDRNFVVTEETYPRLYRLFCIAKEKLEINEEVRLYLNNAYAMSALTVGGQDDYAVILNSSCLEECTDEELSAILGHELGHIGCGHVEYLELMELMDDIAGLMPGKIADAVLTAIKTAMLQWLRTADYTADRAAAICCRDAETVLGVLSKSIGGKENRHRIKYDYRMIVKNARDFDLLDKTGVIPQVIAQAFLNTPSVPFVTVRMAELCKWCETDKCRELFPYVYYNFIYSYKYGKNYAEENLFEQGVKILAENRMQGLAKIHHSAKTGNPGAMNYLGEAYIKGRIIRRDFYTGIEYLQKAALSGHKGSILNLSVLLRQGVAGYLPKAPEKAAWMRRYASGKDNAEGMDQIVQKLRMLYSGSVRKAIGEYIQKKPFNDFVISEDYESGNLGCTNDDLRQKLWIPQDEVIYAYKQNVHSDDQILAICDTGVFYRKSMGMPDYFSWQDIAENKMIGRKKYAMMELVLDNIVLYSETRKNFIASIAGLLIMIKKHLNDK